MLCFKDVSKHFRKGSEVVLALEGVSLDVPKGALATVRGPSGSGKTTLINLAAGLMRPTSGSVVVGDTALQEMGPAARAALRARRIAVVFQLFHLVPYLTALENVLLPTLAHADKDAGERARELIAALGIEHRASHLPDELSAGERQRCALARALLNRPDLILADEPTGNLDPDSAERVLKTLSRCREDGATVLLVTHQPAEAVKPDLEFVLADGKLQ